jgi:tetratricopeptide (TPR) repeat protein
MPLKMGIRHLACAMLLLFPVLAPAREHPPGPAPSYAQLLARVYDIAARAQREKMTPQQWIAKGKNREMDFTLLRMQYMDSPERKRAKDTSDDREQMMAAFKSKNADEALRHADAILAEDFVDLPAQYVAYICHRQRKEPTKEEFHKFVVQGLVNSIHSSGDGMAPATAFIVISSGEESMVLDLLGLVPEKWDTLKSGGHIYDVIDVRDADRLSKIYFNIDIPTRYVVEGAEAQANAGAPAPVPASQAPEKHGWLDIFHRHKEQKAPAPPPVASRQPVPQGGSSTPAKPQPAAAAAGPAPPAAPPSSAPAAAATSAPANPEVAEAPANPAETTEPPPRPAPPAANPAAEAAQEELGKGVELYKAEKFKDALPHFQSALKDAPDLLLARMYLGAAYMQLFVPGAEGLDNLRYASQAIDEFKKIVSDANAPKDAKVHAVKSLASLCFNTRDFEQSRNFYQQAIELDPSDPESYYAIGVMDWNDAGKSEEEIKGGAGLKMDDPYSADDKGQKACEAVRAANQARIEEGLRSLQKALQLYPEYDEAMAHLSLLYLRKADTECGEPAARDADLRAADEWRDKALATRKANSEKNTAAPPAK